MPGDFSPWNPCSCLFRPEGGRTIRPPSGRKAQEPADRRLKPPATIVRPPGENWRFMPETVSLSYYGAGLAATTAARRHCLFRGATPTPRQSRLRPRQEGPGHSGRYAPLTRPGAIDERENRVVKRSFFGKSTGEEASRRHDVPARTPSGSGPWREPGCRASSARSSLATATASSPCVRWPISALGSAPGFTSPRPILRPITNPHAAQPRREAADRPGSAVSARLWSMSTDTAGPDGRSYRWRLSLACGRRRRHGQLSVLSGRLCRDHRVLPARLGRVHSPAPVHSADYHVESLPGLDGRGLDRRVDLGDDGAAHVSLPADDRERPPLSASDPPRTRGGLPHRWRDDTCTDRVRKKERRRSPWSFKSVGRGREKPG